MKNIILHCSPPAYINIPSPSLSILKAFLEMKGYDSTVIYWNRLFYEMQKDFMMIKVNLQTCKDPLLLFVNYIAIENNDTELALKVKTALTASNPSNVNKENDFYKLHMYEYKDKVDNLLNDVINRYNFHNALFFGFTLKFEQWVFAYMLSIKLKKDFPNIPIVVGGINDKNAAHSFLLNFPQFDYAIWGEGEYALFRFTEMLNKNSVDTKAIPNLVSRNNKDMCKSASCGGIKYADLNDKNLIPDFSDFVKDIEKYPIYDYALSLETSRGCHWNKCHFCYLNKGYRYRRKSIEKIKDEIIKQIERYNIYKFSTTDNDLIGRDLLFFDQLLNAFIEIKIKYPMFVIVIAEVITKDLTRSIIKKMAEAGLMNIQIGYESTSNKLLHKIQKINTFASNLLFIKFSLIYRIRVTGLNVIYNLFEENNDDIYEAILNLRFLRFFRTYLGVQHRLTPLTINTTSKYYKGNISVINVNEWAPINTTSSYLSHYWVGTSGWHVLDYAKKTQNPLWHYFEILDYHYLNCFYRYSINISQNSVNFREFCNNKVIDSISITTGSTIYKILKACNDQVISLDKLVLATDLTSGALSSILDFLYKKGIVYHDSDYSEIVSIVNFPD